MGNRTASAVLAGTLACLLAAGALFVGARTAVSSRTDLVPYAPAFRGATSGPAVMANAHDGQAFGSLALDPLLLHPEDWSDGARAVAYRAARPLLGWLVMLTSFGSRSLAAWSLLAWTAIGIGVLVSAAYALSTSFGRRADWVPVLVSLPGVAGHLVFGGLSDGLAAGLAIFGLALWLQGRHPTDRWAVVVFCLAGLARETALVVPLALLLATERRRASRLLIPFAVYAAWIGIVWLRLHVLPSDADQGQLFVPLTGLVGGVGEWGRADWVSVASVFILGAAALWRAPGWEVRVLVVVSALLATMLSAEVWRSWDIARLLLPVTVVGACLLPRRMSMPSMEGDSESSEVAVAQRRPVGANT